MPGGVLKARYLAVNTPESTGKIEEFGKKASSFTKEKLSSAVSIIIESETASWDPDSTGDRYLVWVWYKPSADAEYRNLNIEILQNGLAIASNSANNQYGTTCMAALNQAKAQKLNVHSGQKDPDYYYGEAVEMTLKELRPNLEKYSNMDVAFEGVVTMNDNNGVYVEAYDPETDMYYGMFVYYGFNLNGKGMEILTVGNEVRIVGSVQYYEGGGSWQIADVDYRMMKPNDPNNLQKLSDGHAPAYVETSIKTFNGNITIPSDDGETVTKRYAEMALGTSIEMKGLKVVDSYTTTNEESSSKGAFTLECEVDGQTVDVRTTVLYDADGNLIKASAYEGKTIDVKGMVDYFNGSYQIKVFSADNINIH
jgi:DNA/RNA endonuclease YhcR with UshA esterase domain